MRFHRWIILVLLFLSALSRVQAALSDPYRFSLLDINTGLSNNQVKCFLKDSRGFLWIGTVAGLNRYDGYKLKIFKYDSNDTTSLISNDIIKLQEGPDGKIWIKTVQGTCVYIPETEQFIRNQQQILEQYDLPSDAVVEDILKDKNGSFWFVMAGKGLAKYTSRTRTSVHLQQSFTSKNSISTNSISAIGQTSQGDIWLVHQNGILEKLNGQTLKVVERNDAMYRTYSQQKLEYALTVDSDNDLWLYMKEKEEGVFFYNNSSKSFQHYTKSSPQLQLSSNLARGIVEGDKGNIWIGTDHGGINVVHKKNLSVQYIRHNEEIEKSLSHNSINTLYKDKEGIIWVGTFKKGVNYYHQNLIRFPTTQHLSSLKSSLPFDDINAFAEDDKGNLWIGTNGGGLLYLNRAAGTYTRYLHNAQDPKSLAADVIVSLLIDKNKNLWVGTYLGGLDKFDGKTFTHHKHEPGNALSLSDNSIWNLYEDQTGTLWIGTLRGGLEVLAPQTKGFIHSKFKAGKYPIHCDYISSITEDQHGNMWVGGGFGLDVFHAGTGKSMYYSHDPKNPKSLISNNITFLHRDRQNNMWVATTEGLDLYNEKDASFTHFTTENGLPNNAITTILEDNSGNLWISTQNGISHMIIQRTAKGITYSFRNFDEQDGLQAKAFNVNAALKTTKGELVFGGSNGFNLFHPERIKKNTLAPKVVFTDFQLFNKSLEANKPFRDRIILSKAISDTEEITLEHDENVFSIEFAALNYIHSEKNSYRYKLKGFDKEWHTVDSNNRKITYTNLDPGEYEFQVLAANNDGVWNQTGATLKIQVLAPFWQTPVAYFLYAVFVLAVLVLIRRIELRNTKAKFKVEQETREARQLHDLDLMKIKFFTNVSHEFRTPLTLILAPIEKLLNTTKDPEQLQQFQMINKNARRLLNMVNQLLDFKKIGAEDMHLTLSEGNVVEFVQDAVHSFNDLSDKKCVQLSFRSSVEALQTSFDKDKLEKVLFNLLSNAFKFTPEKGRIDVELNCLENDSSSAGLKILEIQVRDTGIGIAKENHKKIFERFFRDEVPTHMMNPGSGIGLALANEFVHLHGGLITVDSAPNQGSCFTVTIPIKVLAQPLIHEYIEPLAQEVVLTSEEAVTETPSKLPAPVAGENKPVILVVEDNDDFRFYLKDSLKAHFQIIEAKDGKEGWQKALAHLPALIVSDLMMPEMNGMDLCKKIKLDSRTSQIPFVLLTAHASEEKQLKGLDLGANDYLTKPFNFEMLLSRIKNLITQKELLQKVFEKKISVQTSEEEIVSLDDKLIRKAIKYVEDNLSDTELTVEEMSKELGVSRVHLYKKMVAITGQSPVEFIRKIRLQHAAQLLEKSQLTVAEVAYKVGFNNRKYFTKYFKEEYQILPSQYAESKHQAESL